MSELSVIQKTYDLIKWYAPILSRLPKSYKFSLGDRVFSGLQDVLEELIRARFAKDKITHLNAVNTKLEVLRYQTRLLHDLSLIDNRRYEYVSNLFNGVGKEVGGWLKQQRQ
ncbi:MAG: diversity-generating retroelement protein Avd [Alkalinema sp. RU_4_3]|nr:diversity-generating retroelement protein Avd [Alkalinema sp. RU_4_3]